MHFTSEKHDTYPNLNHHLNEQIHSQHLKAQLHFSTLSPAPSNNLISKSGQYTRIVDF